MALEVVSVTCIDSTHVAIVFDQNVVLAQIARDPALWRIVPTDLAVAIEPTILSVDDATNTVTLVTTEHTNGGSYWVRIPNQVYGTPSGDRNVGGDEAYTGVGVVPTVTGVSQIDARTIDVFFSEHMLLEDALDPTLYVFTDGLVASSVEKVTGSIFRVTVSAAPAAESITVTCSGIRDLALNPVA